MTLESHWDGVFARKSDAETSWYQDDPEPSLGLILAHRRQAERGVVDIGAGRAFLADRLIAEGLRDIALVDLSQTALSQVRARLRGAELQLSYIVADASDWQPPRKWGVWHDRAAFHFLTDPAAQQGYRAALLAGTEPGSIVIIATFAENGPTSCSGLPVQRHSADSLSSVLGARFRILASRRVPHQTAAGALQLFRYSTFNRL